MSAPVITEITLTAAQLVAIICLRPKAGAALLAAGITKCQMTTTTTRTKLAFVFPEPVFTYYPHVRLMRRWLDFDRQLNQLPHEACIVFDGTLDGLVENTPSQRRRP